MSAKKVVSAAEGLSPAAITIKTLKSMSADDKFALFCKDVHNLVNAPLRRVCRNNMKMKTPSPELTRGLEKPSKSCITHSEINGKNESTVGLSSIKSNY